MRGEGPGTPAVPLNLGGLRVAPQTLRQLRKDHLGESDRLAVLDQLNARSRGTAVDVVANVDPDTGIDDYHRDPRPRRD
jgi:hypothetical protein